MQYIDPANPTSSTPIGFDVDLVDLIAAELDRPVDTQIFDFGGLIPGIQSDRCDIVAAGMFATAEREQQVDFVRYMRAGSAILVEAGNPEGIHVFEDLCGKSAGYNLGSIYETTLAEVSAQCEADGKEPVDAQLFQSDQGQIAALQNGSLNAAFRDSTAANYIAENTDAIEVGGVVYGNDTFGIALPKGSDELKKQISEMIRNWQGDGSFDDLLTKWGLPTDSAMCC